MSQLFKIKTNLLTSVPVSQIKLEQPAINYDHSTIAEDLFAIYYDTWALQVNMAQSGIFLARLVGDLGDPIPSFLATILKPSYHCLTSPTPGHTL